MLAYRSRIDLVSLEAIFADVDYVIDGTGILMGNGQWGGIPKWIATHPEGQLALAEIECIASAAHGIDLEAKHAMVNVIPPKGDSGWHVDPEPPGKHVYRYHLPIKTNAWAWFSCGQETVHLPTGYWYGAVEYWNTHRVVNNGDHPRTHFIVDLATRKD